VLRGLLEHVPASEVAYEVVTGISAGSTLAAAFAVYPTGEESAVVDLIYSIISDLKQSSIFRQWSGGVLEGLLYRSALFDSTPLRELFLSVLGNHTLNVDDRVTCTGASNLNTGLFERFCHPANVTELLDQVIASAAIPGVFIDQVINGGTSGVQRSEEGRYRRCRAGTRCEAPGGRRGVMRAMTDT
jgi:predicted acylesterase/phospholipase RssA